MSIIDLDYYVTVAKTQTDHKILSEELIDLVVETKKLRNALIFYADPETYTAIGFLPDHPCGDFIKDFDDNYYHEFFDRPMPGKIARDVLREDELKSTVLKR